MKYCIDRPHSFGAGLHCLWAMLFCCTAAFADEAGAVKLWSGVDPFPDISEIRLIDPSTVRYQRVHTAQQPNTFAIGAAVIGFKGVWYCSWAANPDGVSENQGTEFVTERRSEDEGRTWSEVRILAPQIDGKPFHSHGSYFALHDQLYFFAKRGPWQGPIRMFALSGDGREWQDRGPVTVDKSTFWAMETPRAVGNGQWIMGGLGGPDGRRPAVALADGDNLREWRVTVLPVKTKSEKFRGFGETTVITGDKAVLAISRDAGVYRSVDAAETWQGPWPADVPMESAKPYGGRLSDGRPYLICNLKPGPGKKRCRLCLLLGQAGAMTFDRVWLLRPGEPPEPRFNGPQHNPQWAYPYAWESPTGLVVVHHSAKEDIEMIAIPMAALK